QAIGRIVSSCCRLLQLASSRGVVSIEYAVSQRGAGPEEPVIRICADASRMLLLGSALASENIDDAMARRTPLKVGANYDDLAAVPENLVAEMFDGELYTSPRPAYCIRT